MILCHLVLELVFYCGHFQCVLAFVYALIIHFHRKEIRKQLDLYDDLRLGYQCHSNAQAKFVIQ